MTLTSKQQKLIWIAAGGLMLFHFAPGIIYSARQATQQATAGNQQKPSPGRPLNQALGFPSALSLPATSAPFGLSPNGLPLPDPTFARLTGGGWLGGGLVEGRGFCRLGLELKLIPQKPGYYGYSTLSCGPNPAQRLVTGTQPGSTINQMLPVSLIMTGQQQDNALKFHIDQQIGTSPDGCAITGYTVRPFGE